uniref:Uncharacterized protein n=1 Tax=Rhizophora mucronata TaxID=61149 RepID=A0A2P2NW89_RHIMU
MESISVISGKFLKARNSPLVITTKYSAVEENGKTGKKRNNHSLQQ